MNESGTSRTDSDPGEGADAGVDALSFTEASRELDRIVSFFEQQEVDVDQLVSKLERATAIVDELDRRLRRTRTQVEELVPRLVKAAQDEVVPAGPAEDQAVPGEARPPGLF